MQYQMLPQLNEKVSKICLGTMTWGQQNTETQAHEQMDMALSEGGEFLGYGGDVSIAAG